MDNLNIPNFIDISTEATQAAIDSMQKARDKNFGPLSVPPGTEAAHWLGSFSKKELSEGAPQGKVNPCDEWVEAGTIEQAHRSVSKKGHLAIGVMVRIRSTSKHNPSRVFWTNKYITVAELEAGKIGAWNVEWLTSLLGACNMLPPDGINARLLNLLFPPQGQPGAQSPLVGKPVMVNVLQRDNFWNGSISRKDEARSFFPMPS